MEPLFLWLAWLPAVRGVDGGQERRRQATAAARARARGIGLAAAAGGVVLCAAGIVLQGAEAGGTSFTGALDASVVHDVLATDFGAAWAVRLAAFLALALVLWLAPVARRPVTALVALAAAALVATPALAGHANATDPRALMLLTDAGHVAAMSAWVGGVACLVLVVPAATRRLEPR